MKLAVAVLVWIVAIAIRLVLVIVGLVAVPFTHPEDNPIYGNREDPVPPQWFMTGKRATLRDYVWRAIRNPTNNLRYLLDEPPPEKWITRGSPNPELDVRNGDRLKAYRYSRSGVFFEYWYVWFTDNDKRPYAEFRIGWKRSPVPGFGLTVQLRWGK